MARVSIISSYYLDIACQKKINGIANNARMINPPYGPILPIRLSKCAENRPTGAAITFIKRDLSKIIATVNIVKNITLIENTRPSEKSDANNMAYHPIKIEMGTISILLFESSSGKAIGTAKSINTIMAVSAKDIALSQISFPKISLKNSINLFRQRLRILEFDRKEF